MEKTVVALFDNLDTAQTAVKQLLDSGFSRDAISVVRTNQQGDYTSGNVPDEGERDASSAAAGAGIGAVLGGLAGLLVGLGALAIPGIGPIVAAGPLATTLAGAGLGAATGGLVGALADAGIPQKEAGAYAEGVRRGGTLVTVRAGEDQVNSAAEILNHFSPVDINQRAGEWESSGWAGDDTSSTPAAEPSDPRAGERGPGYVVDTGLRGENSGGVVETDTVETPRAGDIGYTGTGIEYVGGSGVSDEIEQPSTADLSEPPDRVGSATRADEDRTLRSGHGEMSPSHGMSAGESGTYERVQQEDPTVHPRSSEGDYQARRDFLGGPDKETEGTIRPADERMQEQSTALEGQDFQGSGGRSSQGHAWEGQYGGHQGAFAGGGMSTTLGSGENRSFQDNDADFRRHWETNYRGAGASLGRDFDYERYQPAYQYGWQLGQQYEAQDWRDFEASARSEWERNHPDDAWQDFRPAIYYGWQRFRGLQGNAGDAGQNQSLDSEQGLPNSGGESSQGYMEPGYDRTMSDMSRGFDTYEPDFRRDWQRSYGSSGYDYTRYQPAYQYGYSLATDVKYRSQNWSDIESEARSHWETRHPNDAWEDFKEAVQHAWDRVRGKAQD